MFTSAKHKLIKQIDVREYYIQIAYLQGLHNQYDSVCLNKYPLTLLHLALEHHSYSILIITDYMMYVYDLLSLPPIY